jgi:hypothetical protein
MYIEMVRAALRWRAAGGKEFFDGILFTFMLFIDEVHRPFGDSLFLYMYKFTRFRLVDVLFLHDERQRLFSAFMAF